MKIEVKIEKSVLLKYAIILNIAYASYSTLIYSFLGNSTIMRATFMMLVIGIDVLTIVKNTKGLRPLVGLFVVFGGLYGLTYIFYPANRWVINSLLVDTVKYLFLVAFLSIASEDVLKNSFKTSAYIILFSSMFEPFTRYVTAGKNGYMVFGMRVLISAIILGYFYFEERKIRHLIAAFFAIILILLYGNRSALMISVICLAVLFMFSDRKRERILSIVVMIMMVLFAFALFSSDILPMIAELLEKMGISSRTLNKMIEGVEALTDNNGRMKIWRNCIAAICKEPITGYGIGGERNLYLLGENYPSRMGGVYAHNVFLELILHFGVVIGLTLILYIMGKTMQIVFAKPASSMAKLYAILMLGTIIKLCFSSSIWSDLNVYICLGLALNCIRFQKKKKLYQM